MKKYSISTLRRVSALLLSLIHLFEINQNN